jgi:hypothetical protein
MKAHTGDSKKRRPTSRLNSRPRTLRQQGDPHQNLHMFPILRAVFAVSHALGVASFFVPGFTVTTTTIFGLFGRTETLSGIDILRMAHKLGQFGLTAQVAVASVVVMALLFALALFHPARWAFVAGGVVGVLQLLLILGLPSHQAAGVHVSSFIEFASWASALGPLIGFFCFPSQHNLDDPEDFLG